MKLRNLTIRKFFTYTLILGVSFVLPFSVPQQAQAASITASLNSGLEKVFGFAIDKTADFFTSFFIEKNTTTSALTVNGVSTTSRTTSRTPNTQNQTETTTATPRDVVQSAGQSTTNLLAYPLIQNILGRLNQLESSSVNVASSNVTPPNVQNIQNIFNSYTTGGGSSYTNPPTNLVSIQSLDLQLASLDIDLSSQIDALALVQASTTSSQWSTLSSNISYTTGNVGIGTTTPAEKLEVVGNIVANGVIGSIGTLGTAGQLYIVDEVNGYGGIDIQTFGGGVLDSPHSYINLTSSRGSANSPSNIELGDDLGMLNFYGQTSSGLELAAAVGAVARDNFSGSAVPTDLYFITNKTEKMRITTEGNVGIGTTTPAAKLSVLGDVGISTVGLSTDASLTFDTGPANDTRIFFKGNGNLDWYLGHNNSDSDDFFLYNNTLDVDALVAKGDTGRIGIGTNQPSQRLSVNGNISVGNSDTAYVYLRDQYNYIYSGSGLPVDVKGHHGVRALNDLGEVARFGTAGDSLNSYFNGNVGIGTTTPGSKLTVAGNLSLSGDAGIGLSFNENGTSPSSIYSYGGLLRIWQGADVAQFQQGYMRVVGILNTDSTITGGAGATFVGNVGIGTTAPTSPLDIKAGFGTTFINLTDATYNTSRLSFGLDSNQNATFNSYWSMNFTPTSGSVNLLSNVGIGTTTPSAQLTTTGTVQFANFGAGSLQTDANGNVTVSSDENLKDIQGTFASGLSSLDLLSPITYKWKASTGYDTNNSYTGFSAQNVQLAIPEAVTVDKNGFLTLSDRPILATLVNAVKEIGSITGEFKNRMVAWLGDAGNGIQNFFAKEITAEEKLCVGTEDNKTCITKSQLDALLMQAGQSGIQSIVQNGGQSSEQSTGQNSESTPVPSEDTSDNSDNAEVIPEVVTPEDASASDDTNTSSSSETPFTSETPPASDTSEPISETAPVETPTPSVETEPASVSE